MLDQALEFQENLNDKMKEVFTYEHLQIWPSVFYCDNIFERSSFRVFEGNVLSTNILSAHFVYILYFMTILAFVQ